MRFCSLASSDRQHAIAVELWSAPCGPVHHDNGRGRWAAAARPLSPAAVSSNGRAHHHRNHRRGQQQQTPRATPQWPQRRAPLKTHRVLCRPRPPPPPRQRRPLAAARHPRMTTTVAIAGDTPSSSSVVYAQHTRARADSPPPGCPGPLAGSGRTVVWWDFGSTSTRRTPESKRHHTRIRTRREPAAETRRRRQTDGRNGTARHGAHTLTRTRETLDRRRRRRRRRRSAHAKNRTRTHRTRTHGLRGKKNKKATNGNGGGGTAIAIFYIIYFLKFFSPPRLRNIYIIARTYAHA